MQLCEPAQLLIRTVYDAVLHASIHLHHFGTRHRSDIFDLYRQLNRALASKRIVRQYGLRNFELGVAQTMAEWK